MLHLRIILEEEEVRFPPPLCGSRPGFMFAWQREREREGGKARGQRHSEARVHAAERHSRKASCQPPEEGKATGLQPERFGKKDESGSLSISTACRHCSEPRGPRGGGGRWEVGGSPVLREGGRKESWYTQPTNRHQ